MARNPKGGRKAAEVGSERKKTPGAPPSARAAVSSGAAARFALAHADGVVGFEAATLVYLTLPFLLFVIGWVTLPVSLPATALVLLGIYGAVRVPRRTARDTVGRSDAGAPVGPGRAVQMAMVLAVVTGVVVLSGVGGYAFQYIDYVRHNSFLRDLIEHPWPLAYSETGPRNEPGMLAFYLANSLTPAAVGKVLGWSAANHFSVIWAILGVFLAVCWFLRVVGTTSLVYAILFLFFGGLDIVGHLVLLGWYRAVSPYKPLSEWMATYMLSSRDARQLLGGIFWLTPSNMHMLYGAPQHAFACWLGTLLILYDGLWRRSCDRTVFVWASTLLWSAFTFVGMLPFVLVAIVVSRGRGLVNFQNVVAAGVILGLTVLFVSSNNQEYVRGWLWEYQDILRTWPLLVLFYIVEFGVYLVLCPTVDSAFVRAQRLWLWTAVAALIALPWYHLGQWNDFSIKSSFPALVVMQVFLAATLKEVHTRRQWRRAGLLVIALLLGACGAVDDIARGIRQGFKFGPPPLTRVQHVNELEPKALAAQLFSKGDSVFWRVLAKPVHPR